MNCICLNLLLQCAEGLAGTSELALNQAVILQ